MAHSSGSGSHLDGTTKTTVGYSIDTSGIGYSEISPDIREDFAFLVNDLPDKLDEVMKEIDSAASITDAFTFEPGTAVVDISKAQTELKTDISNLKSALAELYAAFMNDIDKINDELEYNYGWIIVGDVKETSRQTEEVPTETNGPSNHSTSTHSGGGAGHSF
jgi:hypothetical protein